AQGNRYRRRPAWGRGFGGQAGWSWSCYRICCVRLVLWNPCRGRHHSEDGRWCFSAWQPFEPCVDENEYRVRLRRKLRGGNVGLHVSLYVRVAEIAAIG